MFESSVNKLIKRDNIQVIDKAHYDKLYKKYRDEIFLKRYGKTFLKWCLERDKNKFIKKMKKNYEYLYQEWLDANEFSSEPDAMTEKECLWHNADDETRYYILLRKSGKTSEEIQLEFKINETN